MSAQGGSSIVVVGAGVFGLTTAVRLAEAGLKVRVIAGAPPGETASGVAAGMLAPAFETALDPPGGASLPLMLAARDLWPALAARLGVALDRSGAVAAGAAGWLDDLEVRLATLGLRPEAVGRADLEAWAPGVNPAFARGLLCREDWRIEPRLALAALGSRLVELGGRVDHEVLSAEAALAIETPLVLATGIDQRLSRLAPELAFLEPIKGQILHRNDRSGPARVIRTAGAYALASGGGLLAGATMEAGRADRIPNRGAQAGLRSSIAGLFPGLPAAGWRTRVGVRAASPDGLPLAGYSSEPGVFLAVGARRNGWLLAPLVADIVTAAVTGKDGGQWASRLDPSRFARDDEEERA